MPRRLPGITGAPLASVLVFSGLALFFSKGSAYDPLSWIGGAAVLAAGLGLALAFWPVLPLARPDGAGIAFLVVFAALVVWTGASIVWSVEPDRSWEYFNRGVVYAAFGVLGLLAASAGRAVERFALGLAGLSGAVVLWALAGKVVPRLFPDGERVARLRDPLGYWNALALVAAVGVLLGVWLGSGAGRRRAERVGGAVLVFLSGVALLLTYSRGGVVVAFVVVALFVGLAREQLQAALAVLVGGLPAMGVAAWAFTQDGIAKDEQPYDDRLADGLQLGAILLVGCVVVAVAALLLLRYEAEHVGRLWRPERRHWAGAGAAAAAVAVVAVLVASGGDPGGWLRRGFDEFTAPTVGDASSAQRFGELSSNSRWDWWVESWRIFEGQPLAGAGAGSFDVARRPVRRNIIVVVEPHSLPVQFLAETGIVGLVLLLGLLGAGGAGIVAGVRRLEGAERAAGVALGLTALAYALHALVDYDWDFVGLTGPALAIVGLLIAVRRPPLRARRRPVLAASAALLALALAFSIAAPTVATQRVEDTYEALDERDLERARAAASDARALNPLSLEPVRAEAAVADRAGNRQAALDFYAEAVELQPENWLTWYELALYEEEVGLREAAIGHATRAQQLDPLNPRLGPFLERLFNS